MALFFPANARISKIHGQPHHADGRVYYPLFHPAAVLRNPNLRPAMETDFRKMLSLLEQVADTSDPTSDEPPPRQLSLF